MSAVRSLLSQRFLWMALLLSLGIGALSVRALWTLRNDEWTYALKANTNLVGTLAHSLEWTLDSVDQSLITVVEGIESAGETFKRGIRPGDVLVEVNQSPAPTVDAVKGAIAAAKKGGRNYLLVRIFRGGELLFVTLSLK